jgi:hypothetical protein
MPRERASAPRSIALSSKPIRNIWATALTCRAIFNQLLDAGFDGDNIIDGAMDYSDRCRGTDPKNVRPLIYYLRVKGWQQENHHLLPAHQTL